MKSPKPNQTLCEVFLAEYLASIGSKGGKAGTGKAKARTSAQARKAARARWDKVKTSQLNSPVVPGTCTESSENE